MSGKNEVARTITINAVVKYTDIVKEWGSNKKRRVWEVYLQIKDGDIVYRYSFPSRPIPDDEVEEIAESILSQLDTVLTGLGAQHKKAVALEMEFGLLLERLQKTYVDTFVADI
jgi:hypothetical protein